MELSFEWYNAAMVLFVVFLFGLAVGSFLNAFLFRLEVQERLAVHPRGGQGGETVLQGRSFCPSCGHTLAWHDLIPLLSFVLLRGKCRYCQKKISFQYPLVELATAFLFVATYALVVENLVKLSFPQALNLLYLWTIASLLIVVFVYDLKHFIIPDRIVFPAIGLVALWGVFEIWNFGNWDLFRIWDLGFGILPAFAFLAIVLVSKGTWMGMGDVKLAFFMGLFLSWPNIFVALAVAFGAGALVGLLLISLKRKTLRSEVPFGPFLILGTLAALVFGEEIISFSVGLFLLS